MSVMSNPKKSDVTNWKRLAKRRLVHDGSRLTKRLPEHPKQNIKICAHHPLTVFKGVSVDARTVKFSGKL